MVYVYLIPLLFLFVSCLQTNTLLQHYHADQSAQGGAGGQKQHHESGRLGSHARDAADFLAWRAALPLKEILANFGDDLEMYQRTSQYARNGLQLCLCLQIDASVLPVRLKTPWCKKRNASFAGFEHLYIHCTLSCFAMLSC